MSFISNILTIKTYKHDNFSKNVLAVLYSLSGSSFSFVNDEFYVNIYNIYIYLQQ